MGCISSRFRKKVELDEETMKAIKKLFDAIDENKDGEITRNEAEQHWKQKFAKANADMMFGQTDEDHSKSITLEEYMKYWTAVAQIYPLEEIREEVEQMVEGESWKTWARVSITNHTGIQMEGTKA